MEVCTGQTITTRHFTNYNQNAELILTTPPIYSAGPPYLFLNRNYRKLNIISTYGREGYCVRKIRGHKAQTVPQLMTEVGAALQFFDGFGENGNALRECLAYLDEWLPAAGYILVFTNSELLLASNPDDREWLISVLEDTGEWWSQSVEGPDQFARPPKPFNVIFETQASNPVWLKTLNHANFGFQQL